MSRRGWLVAAIQAVLVLALAGKALYEERTLPRGWMRAAAYGAEKPLRGRYVRMTLSPDETLPAGSLFLRLRLDGETVRVEPSPRRRGLRVMRPPQAPPYLFPALEFYLPENAPDPAHLGPGEELWAELIVPPDGFPRPIRLGVKKDGRIRPLEPR